MPHRDPCHQDARGQRRPHGPEEVLLSSKGFCEVSILAVGGLFSLVDYSNSNSRTVHFGVRQGSSI